jgi:hypothetical protein
MRLVLTLAAVLCTALPAAAQSPLYTNADLTSKPVTAWNPTRTPEDAVRILRNLHSIMDRTDAGRFAIDPFGPDVSVVPHDPYWPFSGPPETLPRSLSQEPYPFVAPYWQSAQWQAQTGIYVPPVSFGHHARASRTRSVQAPAPQPPAPAPNVVTAAAGAGRRLRR